MKSRQKQARRSGNGYASPESSDHLLKQSLVRHTWLAGSILAAMVFIAYTPVLTAGFVWDDYASLHENSLLRIPGGLGLIWTTHGLIPGESHYWPAVYSMYWLECRLWGFHPMGYHLVNLLLHILNTLGVWWLARGMKLPGAWLAAALFGLHPVHVESVAWILERKDVLSAFFYLASFSAYFSYEKSGRRSWLGLGLALFVSGMLSKSVVVTLPLAIAIWIWYHQPKGRLKAFVPVLPFLAVAVAMAWLDMRMVHRIESFDSGLSLSQRAVLAARACWFYLAKLFVPIHQTPIYPQWPDLGWIPWGFVFPLVLGLSIGQLWFMRRRWGRGPLAAILFYFITLGPMLGLIDFSFMRIAWVADRFQYLASLGPILLVAGGADRLGQACRRGSFAARRLLWGGLVIVIVLLGVLTWRQAILYESLETLFRRAVELNPASPVAHVNLGSALALKGQLKLAVDEFDKALALDPSQPLAHSNMGWALNRLGDRRGAVKHYRCVQKLAPEMLRPMNDLAWFLATSSDPAITNPQEAIGLAEQICRRTGDRDPAMLDTLAAAYGAASRFDEAVQVASKAVLLASAQRQLILEGDIRARLKLYQSHQPYKE